MTPFGSRHRHDLGQLRVAALLRIVVAYALLVAINETADPVFYPEINWDPVSLACFFDSPPSAGYLQLLHFFTNLSGVALLAGLFTHTSGAVFLALATLYASLQMSFGTTFHGNNAVFLTLIAIVASDWGSEWSVDAVLRRRKGSPRALLRTAHANWPIWVATFASVHLYSGSGLVKVVKGAFTESGALSLRMVQFWILRPGGSTLREPVLTWFLAHPIASNALACTVVALEAAAVVALLSGVLRLLVLGALLSFHGFSAFLLRIDFSNQETLLIGLILGTAILLFRSRGTLSRWFPEAVECDDTGGESLPRRLGTTLSVALGTLAVAYALHFALPEFLHGGSAGWRPHLWLTAMTPSPRWTDGLPFGLLGLAVVGLALVVAAKRPREILPSVGRT